jgi:hypothetical protein
MTHALAQPLAPVDDAAAAHGADSRSAR